MCCGRSTWQTSNPAAQKPADASIAPPNNETNPRSKRFEYTGKTALTVVSPLTGKKYRFTKPGDQLDVDARDRSWMAFVPNLRSS
jgi:hypothetical protein